MAGRQGRLSGLIQLDPGGLGLYVHIPFCASICNYCNFNRGLFDRALKDRYVDALRHEILSAGDGAPADSIFFGGGTPSMLEPAEIASIVDALRHSFDVAADAEVTLEANPETVDPSRLAGFRAAGINRISFGVQSFRNDDLVRLGRTHTVERAVDAVTMARQQGFTNISLDLMMWLPQQSVAQWLESVDALVTVGPEHASLYLLEVYPNAPLKEAMARSNWSVAPDDDAADMYLAAMERLESAGYRQYEISNVARPGRESRHNWKYWTGGHWLGFGCGAHSTRNAVRWRNMSSTSEYISSVLQRGQYGVDRRTLPLAEQVEEAMFMGLRLTQGVDLDAIEGKFGLDLWCRHRGDLEPFLAEGLLIYDPPILRLSRAGMLLANEIMKVFISPAVR